MQDGGRMVAFALEDFYSLLAHSLDACEGVNGGTNAPWKYSSSALKFRRKVALIFAVTFGVFGAVYFLTHLVIQPALNRHHAVR